MNFLTRSLAAAAVVLATPAMAEKPSTPPTLVKVYDLFLGGIKGGEMAIVTWISDESYHAEAVMRTAGVVGLVYNASFTATSEGAITPDGYTTERFKAQSAMYEKSQYVEMTYDGAAPASVYADPPFVPKPWEIEPTAQSGTIDPITAAITALAPMPVEQLCRRSVEIFDGRKRYAVELGAPEPDQGRIRCPAVYRRIAGFKPKQMRETPEFPFSVWFEVRDDGLAHVKRAAGDSMFGIAVVLARD